MQVFEYGMCMCGCACVVQLLSGPKTFLDVSFVFFRSLIGNFVSFFAFSHSLIGNFLSFLLSPTLLIGNFLSFFLSPTLLIGNFPFFVFFRGQGLTFSPWIEAYGKLGFWAQCL